MCACVCISVCVCTSVYRCTVHVFAIQVLCDIVCVAAVLRTHAGGTVSGSAETVCEPRCWEDGTECQQCGHE